MATTTTTTTTAAPAPLTVTGASKSRLAELRKYVTTGTFFDLYLSSTSLNVNGVNENLSDLNSNPQVIVYYIDEITYTDYVYGDENLDYSTFTFFPQGYSSPDFVDLPLVKDPNESSIVQNPKVYNDVFIVRQELSAFDKNYKLKDVKSLAALKTYAGGQYFNIVSNT